MTIERSNTHSFDWQLACQIGVEKAILIGYFQYWISENEKRQSVNHFRQGEYWTYSTGSDLVKIYPYMKAPSIYRWLSQLESDGWIKTGQFNEKQIDQTKWYGRGEKLIQWLKSPIYQNDNSSSQNDNSNSQNDKPIYQNDNSSSQNDKCNIEDTVINPVIEPIINQQQPVSDEAVPDAVVDAEKKIETGLNAEGQKKGPAPAPNPLPTADEVRAELTGSGSHWRYARQQLKIVKTKEEYAELVETFILQQEMNAKKGQPIFQEMHKVRNHFNHWLGKRATISQQQQRDESATAKNAKQHGLGHSANSRPNSKPVKRVAYLPEDD